MITESGVQFAKSVVKQAPADSMIIIWASMPCTGGSPWQNINRHLPGGMDRLRKHWDLWEQLWTKFEQFVDWLDKNRPRWRVTIEWPQNCDYWRRPKVLQFCARWRLQETLIDGCSLGVKTQEGLCLKKPWRLCSNDPHMDLVFRKVSHWTNSSF